jgi:hypothetical protein
MSPNICGGHTWMKGLFFLREGQSCCSGQPAHSACPEQRTGRRKILFAMAKPFERDLVRELVELGR